MHKKLAAIFLFLLMLAGFNACKTEDINPLVDIAADSLVQGGLGENQRISHIIAHLNGAAKGDITIQVAISGTATEGSDFTLSSHEILLKAGSLSASVQLESKLDGISEGQEEIILNFSSSTSLEGILPSQLRIQLFDLDTDTDGDGIPDASDYCPNEAGSAANSGCPAGNGLIFNEILYDPSNIGLSGDANGDGVYDQNQDEFVEIVNANPYPVDLSGMSIWDSDTSALAGTARFTFPSGTKLQPGKATVVFGGGTPTGSFGQAQVFVSTDASGLSLGNSGEIVLLRDSQGNEILRFNSDALSNNPDESYTRFPDLTGDFVQHGAAVSGVLFSPGTKVNGNPF